MIRSLQNGIPYTALKSRQAEIKERLAAMGLARGPRRVLPKTETYEATFISRFRAALESLGVVFSSFGLYLSSRIDLLPLESCLELAAIKDSADATPFATVWTLFSEETGCALEDAFLKFDEEPFESRLFYQLHAALLEDGTPVIVKIIHPETEEPILCDVELLWLIKGALLTGGMTEAVIKNVLADFRHTLRQQVDFIYEAKAHAALAQDAEEFDMLKAARVQRDFSTSKVLVLENLGGASLSDVVGHFSSPRREGGLGRYDGVERCELARMLAAVWLRQALLGHIFPVELRPENIRLLPDKRLAFTGGVFSSLPPETQANLWDYLIAVSTDHPDRACSCFLREMRKEFVATGDDELRHRFRQIVPFRDGVWKKGGDGADLSEYLFTQWRQASDYGYLPQAHMSPFYRGLFTTAEVARRFAPDYAPLSEAMRDVRLLATLDELRETISFKQLSDQMDKYAVMMTELPQRLDEVLTLASGGNAQVKVHVSEAEDQRRRKNRAAVALALLMVLAAVVMLSNNITIVSGSQWGGKISAILFVAVGALLLRVASYRR